MKFLLLVVLFVTFTITFALAHEGHDDAFSQQGGASVKTVVVTPEGQQAIGLQTLQVRSGSVEQTLRLNGRVEAADNRAYDINPPVSGVVKEVFVKQGDAVSVGTPLALIHSIEIATTLSQLLQERTRLQTTIATTTTRFDADIARSRTQFDRDIAVQQKEVEITKITYDREAQLLNEGVTARKDYHDAKNAYETAKVKLAALRKQRDVDLGASRKQKAQEIDSLQRQFALTTDAVRKQLGVMGLSSAAFNQAISKNQVVAEIPLVSPVSGVVTFRDITAGETLDKGKKIFSVVGVSPVWIIIDVFQEQIPTIQLGQSVRILTAANVAVNGVISSIGTVVDPATRTLPVRIVSSNESGVLKPGMAVTAEVVTGASAGNKIVIPSSALVEESGHPIVFVKNGNNFQPVNVTVGQRSFDTIEITSGLFVGDNVVTRGARQLYSQSLLSASAQNSTQGHGTTSAQSNGMQLIPVFLGGTVLGLLLGLGAWFFFRKRKRSFIERTK
jgi:membrane fusion protein, heavy metal efflux system